VFDTRRSDSPFVERIWRTKSVPVESFISTAAPQWEIVFTSQRDRRWVSIRGPELTASVASIPQDAEFFGIQFSLGAFMPQIPLERLVDSSIDLPVSSSQSFWFDSSSWQVPDFENADVFVERLVRQGLLTREPNEGLLARESGLALSERTGQRRILRSTGLTRRTLRQIQRAERAVALIQEGASPRDVAWRAGYADQAHLTRALKRFVGMTPRQLSQSFKTSSIAHP